MRIEDYPLTEDDDHDLVEDGWAVILADLPTAPVPSSWSEAEREAPAGGWVWALSEYPVVGGVPRFARCRVAHPAPLPPRWVWTHPDAPVVLVAAGHVAEALAELAELGVNARALPSSHAWPVTLRSLVPEGTPAATAAVVPASVSTVVVAGYPGTEAWSVSRLSGPPLALTALALERLSGLAGEASAVTAASDPGDILFRLDASRLASVGRYLDRLDAALSAARTTYARESAALVSAVSVAARVSR